MRDRIPIDKVTVLTANNDAVTLEFEPGDTSAGGAVV